MKRSRLFTKTSKTVPAGETSRNAQLLTQAGFVHKEMAGVYTYLPLGLIVLRKIMDIIRAEMESIGGQEISMTALQTPEPWVQCNRWSPERMDIWFKTKLANGRELGLAPTHEEPLTQLMKDFINSYKDLPVYPYQFQIKFRNELRSKSGLMRGREFWMKDLYSFSRSREEHEEFYEKAAQAYVRVFDKLGIGDRTFKTFASGGAFSKYSHEFQTISEVGEDTIYLSKEKGIAVNDEVYNDEVLNNLGLVKEELEEIKAVEVGNIFTLGQRFSEALGLEFTDEDGQRKPVFMGSYGMGPSRLMGLLAELGADDNGLVWPEKIAPFDYYLVGIGEEGERKCAELEEKYGDKVLWDDLNGARVGEKFADAELMGLPWRIVISDKTLGEGKVELKERKSGEIKLLTWDELVHKLD